MVNPIAIIMPIHNANPKWIEIGLKALYESTDYPFILHLIESESTDGSAEFCDKWAENHINCRVFHTPKKGLANAVNYGLTHSGDMDCYLTQPDVIHRRLYAYDWLKYLADETKNFGAIVTLGAGGISGPSYIDGLRWFGTWSVLLTRETINKVGLLDEQFSPGDDIDYTFRCYKNEIRIGEAPFWVEHHRLTPHIGDDSKLQGDMSKLFRKKWKLQEYADAKFGGGIEGI